MLGRSTVQFSMLVVASLIVARDELPLVGAQLPVQSQTQQQVQPQAQAANRTIAIMAQPQSQTARTLLVTTPAKPLSVSKIEVKPVIRIETPLRSLANATSTPRPKNRMKIVKSDEASSNSDKGFFSSLVDVDRTANKSRVGVHIPLIFDMTNDKDISKGKSKLDLSVLSGLVSVNGYRENGKGPLTVTVFGIPVYSGTGTGTSNGGVLRDLTSQLQSTFMGQRKKIDDSIERVAGSRELPDKTAELYSNIKRTGEKGITSITDQLDKVSSFLKESAVPFSNTNGRAANKNDIFVTKTPQFKPEELKPRISENAFRKFANSNMTGHDYHLQNL